MTIKEAFTLLANKVGSGMKNPFFIARNLHDAFAEIAEKIEGGGGPTTVDAYDVTYKQSNVGAALDIINSSLDSMDDDINDLKEGSIYSTTEEVLVGKWINGKNVYMKVFTFEQINLENDNFINTPVSVADNHITGLVKCQGFWSDGTRYENTKMITTDISGTYVAIQRTRNTADYVTGFILEYTKD